MARAGQDIQFDSDGEQVDARGIWRSIIRRPASSGSVVRAPR